MHLVLRGISACPYGGKHVKGKVYVLLTGSQIDNQSVMAYYGINRGTASTMRRNCTLLRGESGVASDRRMSANQEPKGQKSTELGSWRSGIGCQFQ